MTSINPFSYLAFKFKSSKGVRMFLPSCIKEKLPDDVVGHILSYLPKKSKKRKAISPSLQRELEQLQKLNLKGKNNMYLKEFDDFCLD